MMAQYFGKHIKTPLFIIQSLYDSWSIENILKIRCLGDSRSLANCSDEEKEYIFNYYMNSTEVVN